MVKSRLYGVENIRAMMAVLIPVFNVFTNYPQPYQIGETGAVIGAGRFGAGHRDPSTKFGNAQEMALKESTQKPSN